MHVLYWEQSVEQYLFGNLFKKNEHQEKIFASLNTDNRNQINWNINTKYNIKS
jgi:hypothetical protein